MVRLTTRAMPIGELVQVLRDHGVTGNLRLDSRQITPGDLYIALPGTTHHGAEFSLAAAESGAAAIFTDQAGADLVADISPIPVFIADHPRAEMGELAPHFYGNPTDQLSLIAVTGTNGKTTTAYMVSAGLQAAGFSVGLIGTNGFFLNGAPMVRDRTTITTPESVDLQALLRDFAAAGADYVVAEISSVALSTSRANGSHFAVSAFTNLGQDHLDFHGDMAAYFAAKKSLFDPALTDKSVVALSGPYAVELANELASQDRTLATVADVNFPGDWQVVSRKPTEFGYQVEVKYGDTELQFDLYLPGVHNVMNAVTALAVIAALGIDPASALPGLGQTKIPGRMERVELDTGAPRVLVDFAHTPQAIESALASLGAQNTGGASRTIVVLGAGGDRDETKRGPMGKAAAEGADIVVVTDDNPRTESAELIRQAVRDGVASSTHPRVQQTLEISPRSAAIKQALAVARPSDTVIILGKGHEEGQEIGTRVLPFSDRAVAISAWDELTVERNSNA